MSLLRLKIYVLLLLFISVFRFSPVKEKRDGNKIFLFFKRFWKLLFLCLLKIGMMALIVSALKLDSMVTPTGRPKLSLGVPRASKRLLQPLLALGDSGGAWVLQMPFQM